jgi:putative DNA primase/helicase
VIAEGYATADTLSQALGYPVIAAFDSGNLLKVAQVLQKKYPQKPIVIAGDDDLTQESINGKNPGKEKAMEAAQLVNGAVVLPIFAPGEQMSQQLSDFNDLANKSVLGIDAVKRQMKTVVDKAIQGVKQQKIQNQIKPFRQERSLAR